MSSGAAELAPARPTALAPGPTLLVGAIAAVSAFGAGIAGCSPTGHDLTDVVWAALLAAAVTALGSRATPVGLVAGGAIALVGSGSPALAVVAAAAVALGIAIARRVGWVTPAALWRLLEIGDEPDPPPEPDGGPDAGVAPIAGLGAVSALLTVQGLLRLDVDGPTGVASLVAVAGMTPIVATAWWRLDRDTCRRVVRFGAVALAAVSLAAGGAAVAAVVARSALQDGASATDAGFDAVREGDQAAAVRDLRAAADEMGAAEDVLGAPWAGPGRHLPLVGPQLRVVEEVARTGHEAAAVAARSAAAIDEDGLRPVDGHIDPEAVAAAAPVLAHLADVAVGLRDDLEDFDGGVWVLPPVRSAQDRTVEGLRDAGTSAETGAMAAEVGPMLLGAGGEAHYLLAFVTPSEARGTGFLGNYGLLTITDGTIELTEVGSNDDLNERGDETREITGPPDYLVRYNRFDPADTWQNVTMTPDGPTAGQVMAELYPQSGGVEVDGVISIDPTALAYLLDLTGEVRIDGLDHPIGVTNVVHFLQEDQYRAFESTEERQDLLGEVAEAVFDALIAGDGPAPAHLAGALGPAVRGGHLSVWLRDEAGQRLIERIGADGAVPDVADDGFGVVTQNAGGNKIDVFLHRTITYTARIDAGSGRVRATAEIELRNDAPPSGEPDYLIANLVDQPTGTNRSWVSVYSPFDLDGIVVDGEMVEPQAETELGRNVWSFVVDIPSRSSRTITVEMVGVVDLSDGRYRFDLLPQTMVHPDSVDVAVRFDGAEVALDDDVALPPGGATVDGGEVRADEGGEQGTWALGLRVHRVDGG